MIIDVIETLFSISLFANAFLFLPQIFALYKTKNSNDVSLITFGGFAIMQFLTILHAYIHNDYRLFYGFLMSIGFCLTVCFLIVLYRFKGSK